MNLKNVLNHPWFNNTDRPQNNFAEDVIALKYGGVTAAGLMLFYSAMALVGYPDILLLSAFNIIFFSIGVFFALARYAGGAKPNSIDYFDGLKIGTYTGFIAVLLLAVFVGIFVEAVPQVLKNMNQSYFAGYDLQAVELSAVSVLVNLPVAFISALICMQYFKKD